VLEVIHQMTRHVDRQPGLAGAASARQGHQANILPKQQLANGSGLAIPADHPGTLDRQAAGSRDKRPKRRELDRKVGHRHLVEMHWTKDVAQSMLAKIFEGRLFLYQIGYPGPGCVRDQDLATVASIADPGAAVDIQSNEVVVQKGGLAGVQPDAYADLSTLRPRMPEKQTLRSERGPDCIVGPLKDDEE
jgi:hypothetical protein